MVFPYRVSLFRSPVGYRAGRLSLALTLLLALPVLGQGDGSLELPDPISQHRGGCAVGAVALGMSERYPEILSELGFSKAQELYELLWAEMGEKTGSTNRYQFRLGKLVLEELLTQKSKKWVYVIETTILYPGFPADPNDPDNPGDPNLDWAPVIDLTLTSGGVVELGLTLDSNDSHCAVVTERPILDGAGGAALIFADDPVQGDGKAETKTYTAFVRKDGKVTSGEGYWLDYIVLETLHKLPKRKPVPTGGGGPGVPDPNTDEHGEERDDEERKPPGEDGQEGENGKEKKKQKKQKKQE